MAYNDGDDEQDDLPIKREDKDRAPEAVARRYGHVLPFVMLQRALGPSYEAFFDGPSTFAVVKVANPEWVKHFKACCTLIASWREVQDGSGSERSREQGQTDAVKAIAKGDRVLVVHWDQKPPLPPNVLATADVVVELDSIDVEDLRAAIKLATGRRPARLRAENLRGLDLVAATAAIRTGSTAAECVRRLKAACAPANVAPAIADAPPIESLHGYGEAKEWAERLIADVERWRRGEVDLQAVQRNAVLAGPPGVGKSSFVRSLAKSAGLPLITTTMGTLFATTSGYLDSVIKGIDALFASALAAGPSAIVLIDEIDGIPSRTDLNDRHASWWTPVINHFLTSLDSSLSGPSSRLIVIGATNHPQRLDPALVRPGRLDRIIWVDMPDTEALTGILRQHLGQDLIGVPLTAVVDLLVGFTGAEVAGSVKGARARARNAGRAMAVEDLLAEICPPPTMNESDLWRACLHEAGHVVAAIRLGTARIRSVAIMGGSGGVAGRVTLDRPTSVISTPEDHRNRVVQLLAGRAAEQVLLSSISTGSGGDASSDLGKATAIIAASHFSYGFGGSLVHFATPDEALAAARRSPQMMQHLHREMQSLYDQAVRLVQEHAQAVELLARHLRTEFVIDGRRAREIVASLAQRGEETGRMRHG